MTRDIIKEHQKENFIISCRHLLSKLVYVKGHTSYGKRRTEILKELTRFFNEFNTGTVDIHTYDEKLFKVYTSVNGSNTIRTDTTWTINFDKDNIEFLEAFLKEECEHWPIEN